jgi:hypothetical protein
VDGVCGDLNVVWYESAGCGSAAPAPVCGHPGMLGCYAGALCLCDGTVSGYCDHKAAEKPWAYFVPGPPGAFDGGSSCDPTKPPE